MTEYLRLVKSDVWHFHPRCQHSGELCNECIAKVKKDRIDIRRSLDAIEALRESFQETD